MAIPISRIFEILGWDSVLPVVVASGPMIVKWLIPNGPIAAGAQLVAVVLVPIAAACIRASVGMGQIVRACDGRAPITRQVALAAAIVFLLLFEAMTGALACADDEPTSLWWYPVGFYAGYLAMVWLALRRP